MKTKLLVVLGLAMILSGLWGGSYLYYLSEVETGLTWTWGEGVRTNTWISFPILMTSFIWCAIGVVIVIINVAKLYPNKI
jgi:hypothetical protein